MESTLKQLSTQGQGTTTGHAAASPWLGRSEGRAQQRPQVCLGLTPFPPLPFVVLVFVRIRVWPPGKATGFVSVFTPPV